MNVITKRTILYYIENYPLAANSLKAWYDELSKAEFKNLNDLKAIYGNASIIANNRVIFNIKGNSFRLIVSINFEAQAAYVIWFGTHKAYDKIDAANIKHIKNPFKQ
jgi:mRNA interferase HigB